MKKYHRDSTDFKTHNIYLWQSTHAAIQEIIESRRDNGASADTPPKRKPPIKTKGKTITPENRHRSTAEGHGEYYWETQKYKGGYRTPSRHQNVNQYGENHMTPKYRQESQDRYPHDTYTPYPQRYQYPANHSHPK